MSVSGVRSGVWAVCVAAISIPAWANDGDNLPDRAYRILKQHCYRCHGATQKAPGLRILDRDSLVAERGEGRQPYLKPGDPDSSLLWEFIELEFMPPSGESLSDEEKSTLKQWILAGAEFPTADPASRPFISNERMLTWIRNHLRDAREEDREFLRYFTLVHIHNNRSVSETDLRIYRAALAKALNALSRRPDLVVPKALDEYATVFAIDLRELGWDDEQTWRAILSAYPYGIKPSRTAENRLYRDIESLYGVAFDGTAWIRADWFVVTATRPPLYHTIAQIPATLAELEQRLGVDRQTDFLQNRLLRAGVLESGVSAQNRLVDRHASSRGSFWISYDFRKNSGRGNLARFPLGPVFDENPFKDNLAFEHAGSEIIFELPNGLHGYMLVDDQGNRIDSGPVEIVWDEKKVSGTPQIVNGLSCMACHKHGMQPFTDALRDGLAVFNGDARIKVEALFDQSELERRLKQDREEFLLRLDRVIGPFLKQGDDADKHLEDFPEPISEVAVLYDKDLDLNAVACELGVEDVDELKANLAARELRRLGLGPLRFGRTIKRSMWEARDDVSSPFQETAKALDLGVGITVGENTTGG